MNQQSARRNSQSRRRRVRQVEQAMPLADWLKLFGICFGLGLVGWYIISPIL